MKWTSHAYRLLVPHPLLALCLIIWVGSTGLTASETALRYQGNLIHEGRPAEGLFDLHFTLHAAETGDAPLADPLPANATPVTNGLFTVDLDFDPALFQGEPRWLEIAIRPSGDTEDPMVLFPRQPLRPTPYALYAFSAPTAPHTHELPELSGVLEDHQLGLNVTRLNADQVFSGTNQFEGMVLLTHPDNLIVGIFNGDGAGLTNLPGNQVIPGSLDAAALADASVTESKILPGTITSSSLAPESVTSGQIAAGAVVSSHLSEGIILPFHLQTGEFDQTFWKVNGNLLGDNGFLGTLADQPLEIRVFATRALRLQPNDTNSVNILAGSAANIVEPNIVGATLGGGGSANYLGAPHANRIAGDFGTISGGSRNVIEPTGQWSTIAGGLANAIRLNAQWGTIAGGNRNNIEADADGGVISGGRTNTLNPGAIGSVISGGAFNRVGTNANFAAVPGGLDNAALGDFSFAAGRNAAANHDGAFVWADASGHSQTSSVANEFVVRAAGGTRIYSNSNSSSGVQLPAGAGAWSTLSDRDSKTEFSMVDPREVLERLAALPIQTWRYRSQTGALHMGPMAQDFNAHFNLGEDDRHISTVDADGVAFAGIQGLNLKLEEALRQKEAELADLRGQLERLNARLEAFLTLSATNP